MTQQVAVLVSETGIFVSFPPTHALLSSLHVWYSLYIFLESSIPRLGYQQYRTGGNPRLYCTVKARLW